MNPRVFDATRQRSRGLVEAYTNIRIRCQDSDQVQSLDEFIADKDEIKLESFEVIKTVDDLDEGSLNPLALGLGE